MISVDEALATIFELIDPVGTERISLRSANARILAENIVAKRDQPPFPASAMDGYALRSEEVQPGASFKIIGEAPAGRSFSGRVDVGQTVRIFTGGAVPDGADRVVIQEDVDSDGDTITLKDKLDPQAYIRPAGGDFRAGSVVSAKRRLRPSEIALLASMNAPELSVYRRPRIALLATGDELAMPGEVPRPDQILCSNSFGLSALIEAEGGLAQVLPIARDNQTSLHALLDVAADADLIVTTGGASVGDHDLIAQMGRDIGLEREFYKVAMRPGKPLMAGRFQGVPIIGLPGNPVSSMVCTIIFVLPALRGLMGLPMEAAPRERARLGIDLARNGPREHYMRAHLADGRVTPFGRQDSSLQTVLADANALVVRSPHAQACASGTEVELVRI